jgi:hypothetical protein
MAFVSLNLAPVLRPWRHAGITHLLRGGIGSGFHAGEPASFPDSRKGATLPPAVGLPGPDSACPDSSIWPQAWQEIWIQAAAAAPSPVVVWTYDALGADLRGQSSPERRAALQRLLAGLRLPRGSHAFWPYCLPPDNIPEPDIFMAGLRRFRPGLALLLGSRAAADLAGVAGMPATLFQTGLCRGIPCILLPDLETVDGLADRRREQILTLIRTSLA